MSTVHRAGSTGDVVEVVATARAAGRSLEVRGGGTLLDRLGPAPADADVLDVSGLSGVLDHPAADLTVTVRAGTPLDEMAAALADHNQECPIDAGEALASTVGGRVASALAGPRQAGAGRVRDWLLRVAFVTGEPRPGKAGGKTVKDVTGYDLCRLLCGSWGTIAVLTEVTLKLRPIPPRSAWFSTDAPAERWRGALWWPSAVVTATDGSHVLLEGHPADVDAQARAAGLSPAEAPSLPRRARAALDATCVDAFVTGLPGEVTWAAEPDIGLVHLDGDAAALAEARTTAERLGGRLMAFGGELPAFGGPPGDGPLTDRVARALDPDDVLAPWRWHA